MARFWHQVATSSLTVMTLSMSACLGTLMYFGPPSVWTAADAAAYHRIIDPLTALTLTALAGSMISAFMLRKPKREKSDIQLLN